MMVTKRKGRCSTRRYCMINMVKWSLLYSLFLSEVTSSWSAGEKQVLIRIKVSICSMWGPWSQRSKIDAPITIASRMATTTISQHPNANNLSLRGLIYCFRAMIDKKHIPNRNNTGRNTSNVCPVATVMPRAWMEKELYDRILEASRACSTITATCNLLTGLSIPILFSQDS